ncbi:MAG: HAD-IC family P-type ATPase [Gemmataceae bacterium]|nr:HAD-IC family P-type ATPase [Gemmataceae bacterium]
METALGMHGLTDAEVAERQRRGLVNQVPQAVVRDYAQIVARNVLTWFNAMVTPASVALFALGEIQPAIAVSGMAIVNTGIGLFQEIRAKYHLDQLALLVENQARVLRQGKLTTLPASQVVADDYVALQAGETVVADGPVLAANFLEIDEALLTGESDPVRRSVGDELLSGSVCVAGEGMYRAARVGPAAFAHRTAAEARRYRFIASPLTQVINRIVQVLTYVAVGLITLYSAAYVLRGLPGDDQRQREFVKMAAATITSMVPQGMVLTATVAFTLGALVMSRRGAIVQRLNAVETMAAIDVVCTDKTGTLTTNQLRLEQLVPFPPTPTPTEARRLLCLFASATVDRHNRSVAALRRECRVVDAAWLDQIPFKSQNRYSAVRLYDGPRVRLLVLGAVEALQPRLEPTRVAAVTESLAPLVPSGLRLLLLCEGPNDVALANSPTLPDLPLTPICLIGLRDELRPDAGTVLEQLSAQGIDFKVISGDHPQTVQATISRLHVPWAHEPVVSGDDLARAADRAALIAERHVFGRVAPDQKLDIVVTLQRQGKHVAMIGDGVNDVLSLKRADLGIAMGEGTQASKRVAGLILENNAFSLLPETLEEGRTIVRNLRRSAKLFLVKNVYSFLLILAYYTGWLGLPFPYEPQQVTLLNWLVIGIPAFVIALSRERSTAATKPRFLREVGSFAIRTGVLFAAAGIGVVLLGEHGLDADHKAQRTLLLSTLVLLGLTALWRALTDGESARLEGDRRFRVLGALAVPTYLLAMYWRPAQAFFDLTPLDGLAWTCVLGIVAATHGLCLVADRFLAPKRGDG